MKKPYILGICILLAALLLFTSQQQRGYQRTLVDYQVPEVTLLNQHGQPVALPGYLNCDKPVILEFIFTSCTSLCPSLSIKYANFQQRLDDPQQVRLVSISVDPETDTPEVIRAYLQRYQARPGWDFLTGSVADIKQVMAAFQISPSYMITLNASILLRSPQSGRWTRIDGQLSGAAFMAEYQALEK